MAISGRAKASPGNRIFGLDMNANYAAAQSRPLYCIDPHQELIDDIPDCKALMRRILDVSKTDAPAAYLERLIYGDCSVLIFQALRGSMLLMVMSAVTCISQQSRRCELNVSHHFQRVRYLSPSCRKS